MNVCTNSNFRCTAMLALLVAIPAYADSTVDSAQAITIDNTNKCDQPLAQFMKQLATQLAAPTLNLKQGRKNLLSAPSPRYKQVIATTYPKSMTMKERHRLVDVRLHDQVVTILNGMVAQTTALISEYESAHQQLQVLSKTPVPACAFEIKYIAQAYQGKLKVELETARYELKKIQMQRLFHQAKIAELRLQNPQSPSMATLH